MLVNQQTVSFSGSTDSAAIDANLVFGVEIPASFGVTSLSFLSCRTKTGTFLPVVDEDGAAVSFTTSSTAAQAIDLSNIFPLMLSKQNKGLPLYIKFQAGSPITKDIIIYTGGV